MQKQNEKPIQVDFFLGATTSLGFRHYLKTLRSEPNQSLVLLKGAFGCGVSSMLSEATMSEMTLVERLHMPQEPERLVGTILHQAISSQGIPHAVAILDASAPQNFVPIAPGVCEHVVAFDDALDEAALAPHTDEILALLARIQCLQNRVARYVASMGGLLFDSRRAATCATDTVKAKQYATRLCARLLPPQAGQGSESRRFLSGITPQGLQCYTNTIQSLATRIIVVQDEYGAASKAILDTIRAEALARGYHIITCPCVLFPEEVVEHMIIPSLGLAFVTSNTWHPVQFAEQQNIHCSRFSDVEALKACRTRLRFHTKAAKELQTQCCDLLGQIEECNQAIRTLYRPAIDEAQSRIYVKQRLQGYGISL